MSTREKETRKFFNKFPEPYRTQANTNYDDKFAETIPNTPFLALNVGFDWKDSPETEKYWSDYWDELYNNRPVKYSIIENKFINDLIDEIENKIHDPTDDANLLIEHASKLEILNKIKENLKPYNY
jgi:hypothetical protein